MSIRIRKGWVFAVVAAVAIVAVAAFVILALASRPSQPAAAASVTAVAPSPTAPEEPETTDPPAPQRSLLTVNSNPPGARVEIGLKNIGGVITPGTGRVIGRTPSTVELQQSDVSIGGSPRCNGVPILISMSQHRDHWAGVSVGPGCRLKPGSNQTVSVTLSRIQ